MRIIAIFALVLLAGCAQQILEDAQADCTKYGFTRGTVDFAQCTHMVVQRRNDELSAGFARMGAMGNTMIRNSQPSPVYSSPGFTTHRYTIDGRSYTCTSGPLETRCQ